MATETVHHMARSLRELQNKPQINPSVLVIVIILSVVFICSGILHILARCLGRRRMREPPVGLTSPSVSVRGQLQHLFSLHDSGVEQVFIDTLPVFLYGSIRGLKDSADCAVCLTEFQNEDKLRLLPKCKHAFHMECIDKWLLTNSTCPLCRRSLLPDAEPVVPPPNPTSCTSAVDVDVVEPPHPHPSLGSFRASFRASLRGSFRFLADAVAPPPPPPETPPSLQNPNPPTETPTPPMTPGPTICVTEPDGHKKTLRVELGKVNSFDSRRVSNHEVSSSRMARSYSMGSYDYVVDSSSLRSQLPEQCSKPSSNLSSKLSSKASSKPTHRSALSDSVPELASGQEEVFWASRGLETPHNLSRVREIMTPSPGWLSSPLQPVARMDHDEEDHGEIEVGNVAGDDEHMVVEVEAVEGDVEARKLGNPVEACALQQASAEDVMVQDSVAAIRRQDKLWEVSIDVPGAVDGSDSSSPSLRKSSSLNWLRGRSKRSLVYSAASPSSTDMQPTAT
ncbi:hypothetical protein M758_12G121800 [Ceratodon purpureus]|nr:hypothetical protein M758_12G121800 [Ceratodon purpureus]